MKLLSRLLGRPEVIIDFIFKEGLLYINVKNIGARAAYKISIRFNKRFFGVEGTKEISSMALFKNIEFMPPQKEIITFLDVSSSYFRRKEPEKISAELIYFDSKKRKYVEKIKHDLSIYRDIGYILPQSSG
ncbi:MAG: hypothetical protein KAU16_00335 [Methanophagales archaeon]|nr:hypothetical protein [Methanophagales archaeon]